MQGFTLVEIMVVFGLFLLLVGLSSVYMNRSTDKVSLETVTSLLIADLKQQQLKSMMGETEGQLQPPKFGVRFEPDKYILFQGDTFVSTSPSNFIVPLKDASFTNISFNPPDIIFSRLSGEVQNLSPSATSLIIKNKKGEQKKLILNKYGGLTIQ